MQKRYDITMSCDPVCEREQSGPPSISAPIRSGCMRETIHIVVGCRNVELRGE